MAGTPGKGGVKGRSGRKPLPPEARKERPPFTIRLDPDVHAAATAAGRPAVAAMLRQALGLD